MSKKPYIFFLFYLIAFITIIIFLNIKKNEEISNFKEENYSTITNKSLNQLKTLIKEKQNSTASIGISLTSHFNITKALKEGRGDLIDLNKLSLELRKNTDFKNVWFQLISKDGISLQRSWTKKKGDKISEARLDIQKMMKNPKVMNTISVGKFDLTFKSMSPVFDENKNYLGIIEVITHFNSISKKLKKSGTSAIILADKRYKKQLKNAFTGKFLDDYYIANFDADADFLKFLTNQGMENVINEFNNKKYIVNGEINSIINYFSLLNLNNEKMAHFVLFNSLKNIESTKLDNIKYIYNLYIFLALIFLSIIFYFIYSVKRQTYSKKINSTKILLILTVIYLLTSVIIYKLIERKYKNDIEDYTTSIKHQVVLEYQSIISRNKDIAQLIFSSYILKEKTIELFKQREREKLFKHLNKLYPDLKYRYNIRQIHFHLPDSRSFLRMHKPSKFGDSLKGIRDSVDYVNNYLKPFHGFEEGRIFNGFRHVFPVFDKDNLHLGSVEVSFDIYSFIDGYLNLFDTKRVNLLLKKELIDEKVFKSEKSNYIDSPVEGFAFDKHVLKKMEDKNKEIVPDRKKAKDLKVIAKKINEGKIFSHYFKNIHEIVIIKPLINKLTGKIQGSVNISKSGEYIKSKLKEFYTITTILLIIFAFVMVFIYREILSKQKIQLQFENNQKILDSQSSFIIITNGTELVTSNRSMLEFFGYKTLGEFKKEHNCICEMFLYEEGKDYLQENQNGISWFDHIKDDKKTHKVKVKNIKGEDFIYKVEIEEYSLKNKEYLVTFVDITSIENINEELINTTNEQQQLLSLFDKGEIILFKWDIKQDYKSDYVSNNIKKILGYDKNSFLNGELSYFNIIDSNNKKEVENRFNIEIEKKSDFFTHAPYKVQTKDKKIKHMINNSITIKNDQNEITHILSYIIDISHLKDIEQQLIEQEKMASLGSMIGNIAHQWRQPLSAITTASSAMSVENEYGILNSNKIEEYNSRIIKNAEFLSKTIDTFRNFLKEDKKVKEVVVQDRINMVIEIFDATLKSHFIKIINNTSQTDPIRKRLPLGELSQVLTNLINNAKDALLSNNTPVPSIKIECYENKDNIFIEVEDNAGGIPEDIMDKIFEPYFTTKHQSQGTGLGLYMSHKIIHENLDGKLTAKNTKEGALFIIELPKD